MIAFLIVLFIGLCAALHMWLNHKKGFIAGELISCGSPLFLGVDGMVYTAARCDNPIGICIEDSPTTQGNEWDTSKTNVFEDIKAAVDMLNDQNELTMWLNRQQTLYDMYAPTIEYWEDLQKRIKKQR